MSILAGTGQGGESLFILPIDIDRGVTAQCLNLFKFALKGSPKELLVFCLLCHSVAKKMRKEKKKKQHTDLDSHRQTVQSSRCGSVLDGAKGRDRLLEIVEIGWVE